MRIDGYPLTGAPFCREPVAWVVVRPAQGRGYATEAARSLVALLQEAGWTVVAHIHPGHLASQRVARGAGLSPTADVRDGEIRWVTRAARHHYPQPCARIAVRICRAQSLRHTGEVCQLAGRRCRRVPAGWLAGEDVEGVPVLRAAEGVPVSFGLLQAEDVQAVEQRLGLVPGVEGHVRVIGPRVTGTEQLPGEDPAGGKRPADPRPQGRELLRRTERQAEPGMDQVRGRQVRLSERRAQNADPSGSSGRDARPEQREPGRLCVDRQDQPAASQQLQRISALAAAQVDRQAVLAGPELLARGQQQRPRLTAS